MLGRPSAAGQKQTLGQGSGKIMSIRLLLLQGYFNFGRDRPLVTRRIQANVEIRFFAASNMLLPSTYQTIFQDSPIGSYLLSTTPEVT
jgi:hypothetical protein